MTKNLLRCAGFLVVFSLIFALLTPVFVPKDNSEAAGFQHERSIGFLAEPEDSIDVLFLGDSEAYCGIIPLEIWEDHGITSYLCNTPDQRMYQTYTFLDQFLQSQSPKVVVLETNVLYRTYSVVAMLTHTLETMFPYLQYHDRWKTLTARDWTEPVDYRTIQRDKGYYHRTEVKAAIPGDNMAQTDAVQRPGMLTEFYIRQIWKRCQEEGIQLVFLSIPSTVNWFSYYHNAMVEISQELGTAYIDMNMLTAEIPMDWDTDTFDSGDHLNYSGARKVTEYMGRYLQDMGLFTDKRELPEYAPWNDCLLEFQKVLEPTE